MSELSPRSARFERTTHETSIRLTLGLDILGLGGGLDGPAVPAERRLSVPDGFFGHMLDALATHAGWALDLEARGDTHVDLHHTVEDCGIALGSALAEALGERRGIQRFGHAYAPLDEALARAVVDLSGRGFFVFDAPSPLDQSWVTAAFPFTLVADFFHALADRGRLTLHLTVLAGRNPHHAAEAAFKAAALALAAACRWKEGGEIASTKGSLVA